ncbi:hypothetical protein D3C74_400940 [compost metagenome]
MRNVEKSAGRSWTAGSSSAETVPRPSDATRRSSVVSNAGSPKNTSAPCACSVTISRRMTPAVAADSPPMPLSSALPSSEVRYAMVDCRSLRSSSARPCVSAQWKIRPRLDSCVSLSPSTLDSSRGPKSLTVVRIGMPLPSPPSE